MLCLYWLKLLYAHTTVSLELSVTQFWSKHQCLAPPQTSFSYNSEMAQARVIPLPYQRTANVEVQRYKKKLSCIGDSHTSVPRAIGQLLAHSVYQRGYFCHLFIYHTDSIRHARPDSEGKLSLVTLSAAENSQDFDFFSYLVA